MVSSADASSGRSVLDRLGLLIRRLLDYKPVRFVLVGGVNTVFGYGIFAAIYLLTHHRIRALVAATVLGVTFNYFTTGRLVFANKGAGAIIRFALVYAVLFLINIPLLEVLVGIGLPTLVAQAVALPAMVTLSYLINRYWVFRTRGSQAAPWAALRTLRIPVVDDRVLRWIGPAFVAGSLLLTVLIMKGRLYAVSTDLAQHYELTQFLATHWTWPAGTPLSSGIQAYPPLAHYLGAVVGLAFGSSLIGMNAVVAAAIFLCYLLLARTLTVGGPVSAIVAAALAAAGLWWARSQHAAEGFEVYSNFFYAQLVGEAVFLATALWMSDERRPWLLRWAVAAVLTFVCVWLYMIASVEIALAYLAIEAIFLVRRVVAERTFRARWAVPLLVGAVTLPLLIYVHPYYQRMVQVSNNNGALFLAGLENLVPECAAVLLVVGLLLGLAPPKEERWRRPLLFLAIACCATASAALAQTLVFEVAKIGSPYAVKKYAFSIVTLLVFGVSALVGSRLDGWRPHRPWRLLAIGLPSLFGLAAAVAMPSSKPDNLDRFVAYQREAGALIHDPRTPRDAFGATTSMNDEFSPFLNHALTMVDFGMGQAKSLAALGIIGSDPSETYVLLKAAADNAPDKCIVKVPGFSTISLAKLHCGALSDSETLFSEDLSKTSFLPPYFVSGWSTKEASGVWSDGPKAQLAMHFDRVTAPLLLSISGNAFLPSAAYAQHVRVSTGDTPLAEWTFDSRDPLGSRQIVIPSNLVVNGDLKLDFAFPDAVRPSALGGPGDQRQLGLFVTNLSMQSVRGLRPGDRIDLGKLVANTSFLRDGWSVRERTGIWSSGLNSSMRLPVAEGDADPVLVLEGYGFFPTPSYTQRVRLRAGSATVADWTMDARTPVLPRAIVIPRRLVSGGELSLEFDFPDATSPAAHHVSADPRQLAFFLTAVGLQAPAEHP